MISNVRRYFDLQAEQYHASSSTAIWAWQRRREAAAVLTLLGKVDGEEILELGCGAGYYTQQLLNHGAAHITAVDFSKFLPPSLRFNSAPYT